jgi:hypothetical protein
MHDHGMYIELSFLCWLTRRRLQLATACATRDFLEM